MDGELGAGSRCRGRLYRLLIETLQLETGFVGFLDIFIIFCSVERKQVTDYLEVVITNLMELLMVVA